MNRLILHSDRPGARISRHLYGQFAEHLGTGIYEGIWVGEGSLIPNTRGLRKDVVTALKRIAVPNIRWPGGCFAETYHWRDGVGSHGERPQTFNCWSCGTTESNHFGTHEFMDLCEQLGAEPYICGNLGGGTVQEMADWLAYLTTPASSPLSAERRRNGREQPWPLKWWAVGNENWGCGGHMSAEHYAWEYRRYQTYCRHHSGGKLYRVACGYEDEWNDILLREARDYIDGLSIHHYSRQGTWGRDGDPTDFSFVPDGTDVRFTERHWWETMRLADDMDAFIRRTLAILDRHDPTHRIGLIIDEWGTWHLEPPDKPVGAVLYQRNTIRDAVVAAHTLNIFHRYVERVPLANIAQMVNVLQAMILTEGSRMLLTPTYHVFELFKVHHDATLIPVEFDAPAVCTGNGRKLATLSASASRNTDGEIHISLCNLDCREPAEIVCELSGSAASGAIVGWILTAEAMDAHNTFAAPNAVAPTAFDACHRAGNQLVVHLPARSVVTLRIAG